MNKKENGVNIFDYSKTDLTFIENQLIKDNLLKLIDYRELNCYSNAEIYGLMSKYDFHQFTNIIQLIDLLNFIIPDITKTIEIGAGTNSIGFYLKNIQAITDLKTRIAKHPINLKLLEKKATYKKLNQEHLILSINLESEIDVNKLYTDLNFSKLEYNIFKKAYNIESKILLLNTSIIEREEQYHILTNLVKNNNIKLDTIEQIEGQEIIYVYFDKKEEIKDFLKEVLNTTNINNIDSIIENNTFGDNILGLNLNITTINDDSYQRIVFDMINYNISLPNYPNFIEKIDTTDAIIKYKPETIISSWYTAKLENEHINNKGYNRTDLLKLYEQYKFTYITLGNTNIHSRLEILKYPHFEIYSKDLLFSRSAPSEQIKNRIYIVPGNNWTLKEEDILNFVKNQKIAYHLEFIN